MYEVAEPLLLLLVVFQYVPVPSLNIVPPTPVTVGNDAGKLRVDQDDFGAAMVELERDGRRVEPDVERIEALGIRCIAGNFSAEGGVLRHAADRVAETVLRIGRDAKTASA